MRYGIGRLPSLVPCSLSPDGVIHDGLTDPLLKVHMGAHGSTVAAEEECSREQQDAWALRSHQRALAAMDNGKFAEEIVPVVIPDKKKGDITVEVDPIKTKFLGLIPSLGPSWPGASENVGRVRPRTTTPRLGGRG